MNGMLAWTEDVGMPMRPAMSTMMTTEIPPVDSAEAAVRVHLRLPADIRPATATRLLVDLTDAATGAPITDLGLTHAVWMHLIATRADLATFAHVHPEPSGVDGRYAVRVTFPTAGRYFINTEFRREGDIAEILDRQTISVPGRTPNSVPITVGPRVRTVDGVTVQLRGEARVGGTSDLAFAFTDAGSGAPIRDLKSYLAAAGHVVIMRSDGGTFAHEHADVRDNNGDPVFALPGQRFGPRLQIHATFDAPGIYKLWGQFRLADDRLITIPFTIRAS
jgi:Cu+-exporting ATPase